jgi:hypothetical protein
LYGKNKLEINKLKHVMKIATTIKCTEKKSKKLKEEKNK